MKTKICFLNYIHFLSTIFTFLVLSGNVHAQSVSFTMSSDSVTVGDTVVFTNTSSGFSSSAIFEWDYNDFSCYQLNEVLTPWSPPISCVDSITGNTSTQHVYNYSNSFTITLKAGNLSFNKTLIVSNRFVNSNFTGSCLELICNGNFESFSRCPIGLYGHANLGSNGGQSQTNFLTCWQIPLDINGNRTSSDYYNSCNTSNGVPCNSNGTQTSHVNGSTNNGYTGIFTYMDDPGAPLGYRENISVQLLNSLTQGETYYVSFWVSLSDVSNVGSDIGLLFTSSRPTPLFTGLITAFPQIQSSTPITNQTGWTQVSGLYAPSTNNDNWITIGNFKSNANTSIAMATRSTACVTVFTSALYEAYYYIDDVSIKQIQPLTLSNNTINTCTNPVTISVPNSSNYASFLWSNGSTSSSISVVATTTPTSYTCLAFDNDGCPFSGSTTVTLLSIGVSLTSLPACNGQNSGSATAFVNGGSSPFSYHWLPGNMNTQTITNLAVGNYTVTVSDVAGCTATQSISISNLTIIPPTIRGPQTYCEAVSSNFRYFINNPLPAPYVYTWSAITSLGQNITPSPTSGNQTQIIWPANMGGTVFVSVSGNGCTNNATFPVANCCFGSPQQLTFNNLSATDIINNPGSFAPYYDPGNFSITTNYPSQTNWITINGTFLVDHNFSFNVCHIKFGKDAKIIVNPGVRLFISERGLLESCDNVNMWDGIYLTDATSYLELGTRTANVEIHDAKNAVVANNNASFTIVDVRFIDNYKCIVVNESFNPCNRVILNCEFTSTGRLLRPYNTNQWNLPTLCSVGIELNNVHKIDIGKDIPNVISSAFRNTFKNVWAGIVAINSEFTVQKSQFIDISYFPASPPFRGRPLVGYGVFAGGESSSASSASKFIDMNTQGPTENCIFSNCYIGISVNFNYSADLQYNQFNNCNYGISINQSSQKRLTINNNYFEDFSDIAIGLYDCNNTIGNIAVRENHFNDASVRNVWGRKAIFVSNGSFLNTKATIDHNEIKQSKYGIHALNVGSLVISNHHNPDIQFDLPSSINSNYRGIILENCKLSSVNNNYIIRMQSSTATEVSFIRGISLRSSTNITLKENKVAGMATGFSIFEDCRGSKLLCNTMENCYSSVVLDQVGVANKLSDQGTWVGFPQLSYSWNNKWVNNQGAFKIIGSVAFNYSFKWLYNSAQSALFSPIPIQQFLLTTPACSLTIPSCTPPRILSSEIRESLFGKDISDSIYEEDEENYIDGETFYELMKSDSMLLSLSSPEDSAYQARYDSLQQSNIGKFDDIENDISNNELQQALLKLTLFQDQNVIEANKKIVLMYFLTYYDSDQIPEPNLTAQLNNIAHQHPFFGGEAVYMARAILHLDIDDQLPAYRKKNKRKILPEIEKGNFYPNPAMENVIYSSNLPFSNNQTIEIINSFGQNIKSYFLTEGNNEITLSTNDLPSGIYFCKVFQNRKLLEFSKLCIIK